MLEFIKIINSDYAGVISLLSSLIMVVVTIIYVGHTKRQANYAKESAELVAKQMKIDKQPCIVPYVTDSFGSAWDTTDYTRMQLGFTIKLRNVGDSPAINVYTLADIELQFSEDSAGNKSCFQHLYSQVLHKHYQQKRRRILISILKPPKSRR